MPPQGGRKHPHQEFLQIDTTNVLFIVAAPSPALRRSWRIELARRVSCGYPPGRQDLGAIFSDVKPEDLAKFGLIPEFIGRMPVVAQSTTSNPMRSSKFPPSCAMLS